GVASAVVALPFLGGPVTAPAACAMPVLRTTMMHNSSSSGVPPVTAPPGSSSAVSLLKPRSFCDVFRDMAPWFKSEIKAFFLNRVMMDIDAASTIKTRWVTAPNECAGGVIPPCLPRSASEFEKGKLIIFSGESGSGKTVGALSYALQVRKGLAV